MAKYGIWDVSGSFIIPGARKKGTLERVRIVATDRFKASEDLAKLLNEKFKRELRNGNYFTKHFAAMNLKWDDVAAKMQAAALSTTSEQAAE